MAKVIFLLSAVVYWGCFLARVYLWQKEWTLLARRISVVEKLALLLFTGGLVLHIGKLQIVDGQLHSTHNDLPTSFFLFAWAISAANLVTEIAYENRWSAVFADFWTALALSVSPAGFPTLRGLFTYDLEWLSFHRLCFLLGYAFCALAFPLVLYYCWMVWRLRDVSEESRSRQRPQLWGLDRMAYRMVLWALPLLTAGIITEVLVLLETNQLPGPEEIWNQRQETLLALASWFLCGIYLHTRLFFGWRNLKSAGLFLAGLAMILAGHFTHGFHRGG